VPLALNAGVERNRFSKKIVRVLIYRNPRGRRSERMTLVIGLGNMRIFVAGARTLAALGFVLMVEATLAQEFADRLLKKGIYVIGFFFPVVAKGQARIRVQLSAAHTQHHLDKAIKAFTEVGKELGVIGKK